MKMKNDCQVDYIKEAFDKLYSSVMPYIDLTQFADADIAFKELDKKVHSEIYILKKCLAESDRAVDAGITRSKVLQERISDLESENNAKQHVIESFTIKVNDLEKKIRHLEIENANLRVTPADANAIEVLKRENRVLRCDNKKLAAACEENNHLREVIDEKEKKIHELEEENISKCPWHGDVNAMTDERACHKSLVETIEELNAKKARLEEAYDIHETTTKKENVDLSPGHEFEFGDEVFVPWSDAPYMYVKTGLLYNTRTKRLVYVGKGQHLKWFGEKFAIV